MYFFLNFWGIQATNPGALGEIVIPLRYVKKRAYLLVSPFQKPLQNNMITANQNHI